MKNETSQVATTQRSKKYDPLSKVEKIAGVNLIFIFIVENQAILLSTS